MLDDIRQLLRQERAQDVPHHNQNWLTAVITAVILFPVRGMKFALEVFERLKVIHER